MITFDTGKPRTGRTTRMLEEAVRLAKEDRFVHLVMATPRDLHHFRDWVWTHHRGVRNFISFSLYSDETFDWITLRPRGQHHGVEVLIDHYAVELFLGRFHLAYKAMHRFDKE